jgi:hypothetical protein
MIWNSRSDFGVEFIGICAMPEHGRVKLLPCPYFFDGGRPERVQKHTVWSMAMLTRNDANCPSATLSGRDQLRLSGLV